MKKFEEGDIFINKIKTHPKVKIFAYNGKIYHNNTLDENIQLNNFLPLVPILPPEVTLENLVLSLDVADNSSYPGSGTDWFDTVDSSDMTLENSPTYDSSGFFTFDGTNEGANGPSISGVNDFTISNNYTIEAWFYSDSSQTGPRSIVEKRYTALGAPLSLRYPYSLVHNKTTNQFVFSVGDGSTTIDSSITSVADEWVQCVGVYDWTNDQLKFYKNGTLENTTDISSVVGTISNTIGLTIARRGEFDQRWAGRFAILRVYDKALELSEVNGNFEATRNRFSI